MAKKTVSMLAIIASLCAVALAMALAGCNSEPQPAAEPTTGEIVTGYWELTDGTIGGDYISAERVEMMKSAGLTISCEFGDDSKFSISEFGTTLMSGTWEQQDGSPPVKVTDESGNEFPVEVLDTSHISLSVDGDELRFAKTDKENATRTDATVAGAVEEAINENRAKTRQASESAASTSANSNENPSGKESGN